MKGEHIFPTIYRKSDLTTKKTDMETLQPPKPKHPTKLVRIDDTTWIETKADVPDEVARRKFLEKVARALNPPVLVPGRPGV